MDLFQKIKNIALLDDAAQFELFQAITNAINSDVSTPDGKKSKTPARK